MTDPNTSTPSVPPVRDKRTAPLGVLPKNMQAWVLSGIAAVMVAVIALSGRTPPKPTSRAVQAPGAIDPNAARIQEYQHRIEEQTRKLQLEQAQLMQSAPVFPPVSDGRGPLRMSAPVESRWSSPEGDLPQGERTSRPSSPLLASNIALSLRQDKSTTASVAPAQPKPATADDGGNTSDEKAGAQRVIAGGTSSRTAGVKRYPIFEGTFLETVLTNRLDGYFSGPVNCMVTTHVYSHDGLHLLIPQGSRVLGEVRRVETFGQPRLAVFFHRLILPNEVSIGLDQFQGLNQVGETGLKDQVNHHYMQVFGVSLAIGAIAGFSQFNSRSSRDASALDAYEQGVASSLSQSSLRILDRYLNVLPTLTIREGHRVKVYLSNDLLVPAYEPHRD